MITRIDVEEIECMLTRIEEINKLNLRDIDFYKNDVKIEISEEVKDDWSMLGLGTVYFPEHLEVIK